MPTANRPIIDRHPGATADDVDPRIERTRAAALAAAFALLQEHGPDAVTHGQVAATARISRTTIYKHWPTRADLLRATFEAMAPNKFADPTGDLRTDLHAMTAQLAGDLCDEDHCRVVISAMELATLDPTLGEVRDKILAETTDHFATIIANGVSSSELRSDIDIDLAFAALAGMFVFKRFMVGNPIPVADVGRVVDEFIRNYRA